MAFSGQDIVVARRWFAVKAHPRKEAIAWLNLERQGFPAFLPKVERTVRYPTRTAQVTSAFFPGYLFVSLSAEHHRWRSVNGTIGVQRLVTFGDRPAPAPEGLVEALIAHSSPDGLVGFNEEFAPGATVRIVGGPLDGIVGTFLKASEGDRVTILMTMLARELTIKVPKASVTAA